MAPPIDAVVTWVDGDDPAHAAKRARFQDKAEGTGMAATRFAARDELRYCLISLLIHAPFLRRIFVVTDAQTPAALAEIAALGVAGHEKISLVDHRAIFAGYEELLPTFNSISIEAMLHRIPGLAEQFVMLNDDMILTAPVAAEDWFRDGEVVIRGTWFGPGLAALAGFRRIAAHLPGLAAPARRFSNKEAHRRAAVLARFRARCFVAGHAPYPGLRSHYEQLVTNMPKAYIANASHRFRSAEQFNVVALFNHWELRHHHPVTLGEAELVYLRADHDDAARVAAKLIMADGAGKKFLCLQSLDMASPSAAARITAWLQARFPIQVEPETP